MHPESRIAADRRASMLMPRRPGRDFGTVPRCRQVEIVRAGSGASTLDGVRLAKYADDRWKRRVLGACGMRRSVAFPVWHGHCTGKSQSNQGGVIMKTQ